MSETELRELDAWIAEHVFGFKKTRRDFDSAITGYGFDANNKFAVLPSPTTSPDDAMKVLEKCCDERFATSIQKNKVSWKVSRIYWGPFRMHESEVTFAETLPLAICLFSKKLFSK